MRRSFLAMLGLGVLLVGCGGDNPTTTITGVTQLPDTGVRSAETVYKPGQPLVVSIAVVPDNSSVAYALEDLPPPGWTVTDINEDGVFDPDTGKVKWGVFFNECPHYFTYTVTPPANTAGDGSFAGTLSVDGNNSAFTGTMTVTPETP